MVARWFILFPLLLTLICLTTVRSSHEQTQSLLQHSPIVVAGGAEDGTATTMAAYYADDGHSSERDIVLSDELGIAIEAPPEGLTLKSLWGVV